MQIDYRSFPLLVQALEYWRRQRGDRAMPRRADIDPAAIPQLLPYLRLTEVIDGGRRFRYRLVGTAVVERHGIEYTGRYLDDLFEGDSRAMAEGAYRAVIRERRPVFLRSRSVNSRGVEMIANRILMPLSESGARVDMILAAFAFQSLSSLAQPIGLDHSPARVDLQLL